MAIRGFTGTDENRSKKKKDLTGSGRPSVVAPNKIKGQEIGRPSTSFAAPWTSTRWGDTAGSVRSTATPVNPQDIAVTSPIQNTAGGMPGVANSQYAGTSGAASVGGMGGTTGGGMSTGGTLPGSGAGMTGGYSPMGFVQTIYDSRNPLVQASYVLNLLDQWGLTQNPAVAEMAADAINPALYNFQLANPDGTGDLSDAAMQAYIDAYLREFTRPGGAMPDSREALATLLNADANSLLGSSIGYGVNTPEDQARKAEEYLYAAIYGMNPLAQQAFMNANRAAQTNYFADATRDPTQMSDYSEYLRQSPLAQWVPQR